MAFTYFTQSRKQIAPIYIRYRYFNTDAKARTNLYVDKDRLKGSKLIYYKATARDTQETKLAIQQKNKELDTLQAEINALEKRVRAQMTDNITVTSRWLKQAVNPINSSINGSVLKYYDLLLESNTTLAKNSINAYEGNAVFMSKYQEYLGYELKVSNVDGMFKEAFVKWGVSEGYPMSTIKSNLARLKAVCFYSEERGEIISNQVKNLTKGLRKQAVDSVYLTKEDLSKIIALKNLPQHLDVSRDWLVVSCYIGQRSVSLLRLTKKDINTASQTITLQQVKTKAFVTIPILPPVKVVLDKYKGEFPPRLQRTDHYNYDCYNRNIKEVCRLAGIDEICTGRVKERGSRKSKVVQAPKYKLVSSHIGRRTYATLLYGKVNLQNLMQVTGHGSEANFLKYINKGRIIDTEAIRREFTKALE